MLKVFSVSKNKLVKQAHIELPKLEHEPRTVGSNHTDTLFLGGNNKTVNLYPVDSSLKITQHTFDSPTLAVKAPSQINKVEFSGTKWLMAFSQEENALLYNTQTQKTIFLKPGHDNCTAKSGAVDPQGQYIATSGSDGFLNIYKFTQNQEGVEFLDKVKMTARRVPQDSTFDLRFQWLDDGETILIPGKTNIVFV